MRDLAPRISPKRLVRGYNRWTTGANPKLARKRESCKGQHDWISINLWSETRSYTLDPLALNAPRLP